MRFPSNAGEKPTAAGPFVKGPVSLVQNIYAKKKIKHLTPKKRAKSF